MLGASNDAFQALADTLPDRFDVKQKEWDNTKFLGVRIRRTAEGLTTLDQNLFINRLPLLPNDASFQVFRSVRGSVA